MNPWEDDEERPDWVRAVCEHGTWIACCEEHDCWQCAEEFYTSSHLES